MSFVSKNNTLKALKIVSFLLTYVSETVVFVFICDEHDELTA